MSKVSKFQAMLEAKKAAAAANGGLAKVEVSAADNDLLDGAVAQPAPLPDTSQVEEAPKTFLEKLAATKAAKEAATLADEPSPKPEPAVEPAVVADNPSIPRVELSADVIKLANVSVSQTVQAVDEETASSITVETIRARIEGLSVLDGFDLKTAMDGLRGLILANPSACALLLPEEVGDMVGALRKMTNNSKAAILATPTRKSAAKKKKPEDDIPTGAELEALLDLL